MSDTTLNTQTPPTQAPPKRILVAIIEPQKAVRLQFIDYTLEALQGIVGGLIEKFAVIEDDPTIIGWCNDEFLFNGSPENRFNPATGQFICGTFVVCGDSDGDAENGRQCVSLTREQVSTIFSLYGVIEGRELLDQL